MTEFFRSEIFHEELSSTSDLAKELVEEGLVDLPFVVRAHRQTRGRGRGDHQWWSDEGSLTFTIGFDPEALGLSRLQEPRIALATAIAMIAAFEMFVPPGTFQIRWPNDVESGGRKVAGILPERVETNASPRLLVGIGVNVASHMQDAPEDVSRMAASLRDLGAIDCQISDVYHALLKEIPNAWIRLAREDPAMAIEWSSRDSLRGRPVSLRLGGDVVRGSGAGIDRSGALLVSNDLGTKAYHGGQVLRDLA